MMTYFQFPDTNYSDISIAIYKTFHTKNAFANVICNMAAILSMPQCVNSFGAAMVIFCEKQVNTMIVDALAPFVTKRLTNM